MKLAHFSSLFLNFDCFPLYPYDQNSSLSIVDDKTFYFLMWLIKCPLISNAWQVPFPEGMQLTLLKLDLVLNSVIYFSLWLQKLWILKIWDSFNENHKQGAWTFMLYLCFSGNFCEFPNLVCLFLSGDSVPIILSWVQKHKALMLLPSKLLVLFMIWDSFVSDIVKDLSGFACNLWNLDESYWKKSHEMSILIVFLWERNVWVTALKPELQTLWWCADPWHDQCFPRLLCCGNV